MNNSPWLWVICDRDNPDLVHDCGTQHSRPYAPAQAIADERIARYAHQVLTGSGDVGRLARAVCRVKRAGDDRWQASARGEAWAQRIERARR
ncbi:hypothetical protein ACIBCR_15205 [Micromonospora echinospora]|uniref:hypothetical protein n=1 Tax=Micromonospora echinospora TaxID=1877 RepID=UPI00378A8DE1